MTISPELTIVIPTRNEEQWLPLLLSDLEAQQGVQLELVVSDGGSIDGTVATVRRRQRTFPHPLQILVGPAGRPEQIDRGVALASGRWLLILHADSRLPDPRALRTALDRLTEVMTSRNDNRVAGRFSLRFAPGHDLPGPRLAFLQLKARLNRPGCIHGDQGLMLATERYRKLAPLATEFPMLAETRLADRLLVEGDMLLFPSEIITSSRRFTSEGLANRQTLNALIMNNAAIGWRAFFTSALPLYRSQHETDGPLPLAAILNASHDLLRREPALERRRIWRATGTYVAANAWQLAFRWDVRRQPTAAVPATQFLDRYDRFLAPVVTSQAGQRLAQLLVWCWFHYRIRAAGAPKDSCNCRI